MSHARCPKCHRRLKALFISLYCPECDKPKKESPQKSPANSAGPFDPMVILGPDGLPFDRSYTK